MKPDALLALLEATAEPLKVRVSYETLQASVIHGGGLCRVKGEYRVIVDKRATAEERCTTLAAALAQVIQQTKPDIAALGLSSKVLEALKLHAPRRTRPAA
ncbi:MAG TPA: hypothetical protein VGC42_01920 [Kofleriaceae bacterium]